MCREKIDPPPLTAEQEKQLTIAERLARADKIRSQSPKLHDIDIVALIREDRDR